MNANKSIDEVLARSAEIIMSDMRAVDWINIWYNDVSDSIMFKIESNMFEWLDHLTLSIALEPAHVDIHQVSPEEVVAMFANAVYKLPTAKIDIKNFLRNL